MKPAAIVIAAAVALIPVAGIAEPRSDLAERVLDYLYPHRVKPVPIPLPPTKPVEIAPVPEEPLPTATPAPKEVMPEQQSVPHGPNETQPASAEQERPARATPELPKAVPKLEPPKQADRSKTFRKEERQRSGTKQPQQEPLSGGGQRSPPTEADWCFFPITCAYVCERARAGDSRRGTACQNARGLACVKSTCPDVLKKKR